MTKKPTAVKNDILFLHPPSSFNKTRFPLSGMVSLGYEESGLFLYPPVGINALYHKLKSHGFNPGFLNVGRLFYNTIKQGEKFDLTKIITDFSAKGFGIDLHWAVHTPGALDLSEAIKKIYPDSFIFLGGLTATYFYREILDDYPYIDAVVLGEADEAIVSLAETLNKNSSRPNLEKVPNLAYRSGRDGHISVNPVRIPDKWENISFQNVEDELTIGYISIKGCSLNCSFCGGSKSSYENFFYRDRLVALDPGQLIHEIETFEKKGLNSAALVSDIRMMGKDYVDSFLKQLAKKKFNIRIMAELFYPPEPGYLEQWKKAASRLLFTFKIEASDAGILQRIGKGHTPKESWDLIKKCSQLEIPLELYFIFPLPGQNSDGIRATMDFIEQAVEYPHISFVIETMFYISPGSPIFENPVEWGYHVEFRTLKDFRKNLEKPHWSQSLGFHTRWLSKEEIIDMIFYVAERTNRIHYRQNPDYAPLYLLNTENIELNLKLIEQLREKELQPGIETDNYFKNNIKKIFPAYLLKGNLLRKTRILENDRIPYTLFPNLSYLLMQVLYVSPHRLMRFFKQCIVDTDILPEKISLEAFKKAAGAPDSLKKEILNIIEDMNINRVFIENLMDFEWTNKLASIAKRTINLREREPLNDIDMKDVSKINFIINESVVLKTFKFDFDRIDWKNFSTNEPITPNSTHYLYSLQEGNRRVITPSIMKLITLCDGKRNIPDIINILKETEPKEAIAAAVNLGTLISSGILSPKR